MHITYFTDVHKSDQVKGLSWAITENIFCRVENLSIPFFRKAGETIAYYICNSCLNLSSSWLKKKSSNDEEFVLQEFVSFGK